MTVSVYTQISIWGWIEYNGKLASIVREPYDSKVSIYGCVFPPLRDILFRATKYPGTNKAGEIIMVPHTTNNVRKGVLLGIGDKTMKTLEAYMLYPYRTSTC
ncbi:hypothetical protein Bca4012_072166 [Brassica carinata]